MYIAVVFGWKFCKPEHNSMYGRLSIFGIRIDEND